MSFDSLIQALVGLARVALASFVLVWVPLADAATCAGNDNVSIEVSIAGDSATSVDLKSPPVGKSSENNSTPSDAQHCVHGHCHQTAAPQSASVVLIALASADVNMPSLQAHMPSCIAVCLERPPKA